MCASREVIESLREHVFNDVIWPDLRTWSESGRDFVRFRELVPEESVQLGDLTVTPVPVNHTVPTFGYIVESADAALVLSGDTGPTERIWELAAANPRVRAVFLECAFPDALGELADAAKLPAKLRMSVSIGGGLDYRSVSEVLYVVPSIDRVSVGRALVARALLVGIDRAVRDLLASF